MYYTTILILKEMGKSHHVAPSKSGEGWQVKKSGAERASKTFDTKKQAVDYGREVSRNQKSELFIHNSDGKIASRDSHGNDPSSSKG